MVRAEVNQLEVGLRKLQGALEKTKALDEPLPGDRFLESTQPFADEVGGTHMFSQLCACILFVACTLARKHV
jgi:hypothetical protein